MSDNRTPEERFWAKVDRSGDCWLWTASINYKGYGSFWSGQATVPAHRFAYAAINGPITEGLEVDHICHVRSCVRPTHLRVTTRKQNAEHLAGPQSNSTSKVRGVFWYAKTGRWRARLRHNGQNVHVGYFLRLEDADAAIVAKRNELFTHNDADRSSPTTEAVTEPEAQVRPLPRGDAS